MLSLLASLFLALVIVALTACAVGFQVRRARRLQSELQRMTVELEARIEAAACESRRLEAIIATANSLGLAIRHGRLADIESLADPAAMNDAHAIAKVAERSGHPPAGVPVDLFDADENSLRIARLIVQGHSAHEISRRLGLPIGEVELRMSVRPA